MSWPFRSWGRGALMAHEEVAMQPVAIVFALADVPQGRREPKFVRRYSAGAMSVRRPLHQYTLHVAHFYKMLLGFF